jgi:hypothetical protein
MNKRQPLGTNLQVVHTWILPTPVSNLAPTSQGSSQELIYMLRKNRTSSSQTSLHYKNYLSGTNYVTVGTPKMNEFGK